jgi:hypothetical protein
MQGIGFLVRERVFHQGSWGYSDLPFFVCAFGSERRCQSLPPKACSFFSSLIRLRLLRELQLFGRTFYLATRINPVHQSTRARKAVMLPAVQGLRRKKSSRFWAESFCFEGQAAETAALPVIL